MTADSFDVGDYLARRLRAGDIPMVRQLFEACAAFFQLIHGDAMQEADHILDDVPPGKTPEDKLVFGISSPGSQNRLDALTELLRGYPGPDDWCIGLLLVSPERRNHGLGGAIVAALARHVHRAGGRALHLIVQEQNQDALRFWLRHGFSIQEQDDPGGAARANCVHKLTRKLEPAITGQLDH